MDFGSIVESLSSGPFNWASGPVSSAYAHNSCTKNHYHRHCMCAIHSIDSGFKGSAPCSPSNSVKVAGGAGGFSGRRICRSISVKNLRDKEFQSGGNSYSGDDPMSPKSAFGSNSFMSSSRSSSSLSQVEMGNDDELSVETLALVEELASFINLIKDKDSAGCYTGHDDNEIESVSIKEEDSAGRYTGHDDNEIESVSSDRNVPPAVEDGSPSFSFTSLRILVQGFLSASSKHSTGLVSIEKFAPDHSCPPRLSPLGPLERKLSIHSVTGQNKDEFVGQRSR